MLRILYCIQNGESKYCTETTFLVEQASAINVPSQCSFGLFVIFDRFSLPTAAHSIRNANISLIEVCLRLCSPTLSESSLQTFFPKGVSMNLLPNHNRY